jgi:hypothetical protein
MSDKKINTFFHLIFCSRAKNVRFITFFIEQIVIDASESGMTTTQQRRKCGLTLSEEGKTESKERK